MKVKVKGGDKGEGHLAFYDRVYELWVVLVVYEVSQLCWEEIINGVEFWEWCGVSSSFFYKLCDFRFDFFDSSSALVFYYW